MKKKYWITKKYYPHYFSFAVPTELIEDAKIIINKININYGLIEIRDKIFPTLCIRQSAKRLHDNVDDIERWKHKIQFRLNSALIGYMQRAHKKEENNENI